MMARGRSKLFLLLAVGMLASCGGSGASVTPTAASPTPTPAAGLKEGMSLVPFGAQKIPVTVYGHGPTVVLLANMGDGGESQWDSLVSVINRDRFTTLTFSYVPDPDALDQFYMAMADADALHERLVGAGYARIICIGASLGVTACGQLASKPEIVAEALIAGPNDSNSGFDRPFPKLFVAGADDPYSDNASSLYESAAEPKKLVLYNGNASHATDIFDSSDGPAFVALLKQFIDDNG